MYVTWHTRAATATLIIESGKEHKGNLRGRGLEARSRIDGRLRETSRVSSATGYLLTQSEVGRFRFGEKGEEVRTDEKAHSVVDRGADVGAVDVVWGRSVR